MSGDSSAELVTNLCPGEVEKDGMELSESLLSSPGAGAACAWLLSAQWFWPYTSNMVFMGSGLALSHAHAVRLNLHVYRKKGVKKY